MYNHFFLLFHSRSVFMSKEFWFHQAFISICILRQFFYLGTMSEMLEQISDKVTASSYSFYFNFAPLFALWTALLGGFLVDRVGLEATTFITWLSVLIFCGVVVKRKRKERKRNEKKRIKRKEEKYFFLKYIYISTISDDSFY